jgi:hypothetical protein
MNNGDLEYDGFATLRDADGNIIKSYKSMGLSSDNSIEGALLYLLGVNSGDTEKVAAVRKMMEKSGLQHSFDIDPDKWYWKGEHETITGSRGSFPAVGLVDLGQANMGRIISLESISGLFSTSSTNGPDTQKFVERIYGTAINFLNYAESGANIAMANLMLSSYYNPDQMSMIEVNRIWLNNVLKNGINISATMVVGDAHRSQEFDVTSGSMKLSTSSVANAATLVEDHPGIDHGGGGTQINTPGGYWAFIDKNDHRAYYQLYGGDLKMRVMHIDPEEIKKITKNDIFGSTTGSVKLLNYPTESFGSGTGAHTHIDMTRLLPYNGQYTRQFVNPETLYPGSRLNYYLKYSDATGNILQNLPYNRY